MEAMSLEGYIGKRIWVAANDTISKGNIEVTLRGLEAGGIWIEEQGLTNRLLSEHGVTMSPETPWTCPHF